MSSDAPSHACCTLPPVVRDTDSYQPKGSYISFEHTDKEKFSKDPITKAYVTGPTDTGKTIIIIFDIFGQWLTLVFDPSYYKQTVQGADLLAETVKAKVIMPDFFRDKPMDLNLYPPTTDEARKTIQTFFQVQGNFGDRIPELLDIAKGERNNGVEKLGLIGYCWGKEQGSSPLSAQLTRLLRISTLGGKMAALANATGEFDATASVHPAMWARADGENLKAPVAVFPSKDENQEEIDAFMEIANKKPFASKNKHKR
ncbi:hypothetical protein FRC01_009497, partial [Tulasnella sp. 417]